MDVIRNVLTEMYDDLDFDTEFETVGTQAGVDTRGIGTQAEGVNVEKLQGRLRTLEKVIDSQEKIFYEKHRVLNELQARNASEDVINVKEQEINELQDKLKKVKAQRNELLDEIEVGDIILKDTLEEVKNLKEENRNVKEKFEKFKKAAEIEKENALEDARKEYYEHRKTRVDQQKASERYWSEHKRITTEFKNEIRVAEAKQKELGDRLKEAEEKLKFLQQAEHKQHENPDSTDRVVPGVQKNIDRIYSIIERSDPKYDELDDDELDDDKLEKLLDANLNALREQAEEFEQKAKNSEGITKQTYEDIQKNIELKIDEFNLRLDRPVEYEVTKQKLKEEVENNPGVR